MERIPLQIHKDLRHEREKRWQTASRNYQTQCEMVRKSKVLGSGESASKHKESTPPQTHWLLGLCPTGPKSQALQTAALRAVEFPVFVATPVLLKDGRTGRKFERMAIGKDCRLFWLPKSSPQPSTKNQHGSPQRVTWSCSDGRAPSQAQGECRVLGVHSRQDSKRCF